jgi:hypothetical protein
MSPRTGDPPLRVRHFHPDQFELRLMDIGKPRRTYIVEPIEAPVPREHPKPPPERAPAEPPRRKPQETPAR